MCMYVYKTISYKLTLLSSQDRIINLAVGGFTSLVVLVSIYLKVDLLHFLQSYYLFPTLDAFLFYEVKYSVS